MNSCFLNITRASAFIQLLTFRNYYNWNGSAAIYRSLIVDIICCSELLRMKFYFLKEKKKRPLYLSPRNSQAYAFHNCVLLTETSITLPEVVQEEDIITSSCTKESQLLHFYIVFWRADHAVNWMLTSKTEDDNKWHVANWTLLYSG